ncbi:MAG: peptidylprolyl isomerase [Burkholderiales bacterium]|nr:peptidylprolyl isomerase [Burkholderiales bacterium]
MPCFRHAALAAFALYASVGIANAIQAAKPANAVVPIDRIIAVVNGDVITEFDLGDQMKFVTRQLSKQETPLPPREVLEKQLLERMINERVQMQFAKETGLRIDDAQLEKTIGRIAQENSMTVQAFRDALVADGISFNKFREEIRGEIIKARLKEREVDNKITVTDSEIDNFMEKREAQIGQAEEYNLAHVLVRVPEQASPEQVQEKRARAEQALAQLKEGAPFAQVSAGFSDAPDALEGGSMGWRAPARLPDIFVEPLKTMKTGEVSAILRSPNGFHILKLQEKRGGDDAPVIVEQTNARHILIKPSELTSEADAKKRLTNLKERLDNGADFAELARLNSEDGSAGKGGDLGWISPSDTVPDFERAMAALQPGQISEPIQSQFGWHLIQVLDRRKEDVSEEKQRLLARQAVRARKSDEAYQEWLRQLRDQAYVEYRLEDQ